MTLEGKTTLVRFPLHRIADIHLPVESCNLEIIAHELEHALRNRILLFGPSITDIQHQRVGADFYGGTAEEEIAYEMGGWVAATVSWLTHEASP